MVSWTKGVKEGGAGVLDYSLWYAPTTTGSYSILASGITETIKVNVLTMGLSYKFKVAARNSFGFSLFSNEV